MRRRPLPLIAGIVIILAALGVLLYEGLSSNLVYYITPSELLAKGSGADGQDFRLGGQVRPGTVRMQKSLRTVRFILQDPKGRVAVVSHTIPPPMFRAGIGVVVEGVYHHGYFTATTLMVKHCASYRAPTPGTVPAQDNCVT